VFSSTKPSCEANTIITPISQTGKVRFTVGQSLGQGNEAGYDEDGALSPADIWRNGVDAGRWTADWGWALVL
jgi:hypothetical protein